MDAKKPFSVREFPLSAIAARKIVKDLAENHTSRIRLSNHARERMKERGVISRQVLEVLRSKNSYCTEEPHPTPSGSWKFNLKGFAAGSNLEVVVDIKRHDEDPMAYIVTVIVK